ncbi:MAG: hypothetical protein JNL42_11035 [Anaerolineae bacterium]|nr:hypothetical protein [Anaerolineae bacterium]
MADDQQHPEEPDWMHEFDELARRELGEGSACEQVHPIIEQWYRELDEDDIPPSRPSVEQAVSCLATEIMLDTPPEILDEVVKHVDEDTLAWWIEHILTVGRALEASLRDGGLDDL